MPKILEIDVINSFFTLMRENLWRNVIFMSENIQKLQNIG